MPALLVATELVKTFQAGDNIRPVLRGVSLTVEAGEWVAIMGPSGCGKSTFLHLLGGLDVPDRGTVLVDGEDMAAKDVAGRAVLRRHKVGYVFQQYNLIPHLDVAANIELPLRLANAGRREARTRRDELLEALGLTGHSHALPATLSGGEQQRVAVARALANRPKLLLADEPTGALDSVAAAGVMALLTAAARPRPDHRDGHPRRRGRRPRRPPGPHARRPRRVGHAGADDHHGPELSALSAFGTLVLAGLRGRSKVGLAATFAVLALAAIGVSVGLAVNQGGAPLLDRVADEARVAHLVIYGEPEALRTVAADPEVVAFAGPVATLDAVDLVLDGERVELQVTVLDDPAVAVNQPPQRAGRWARSEHEIVLDRSFAADVGVAVGDQVSVDRAGTVSEFAVVGTAVNLTDCFYPNCDPGRTWVTQAGMDRLAPDGAGIYGQAWLRFADPAQADAFVERQAEAGVTGVRGTDSWLDTRGDFLALDQVLGAVIAGFGGFVLAAAAVIVAGTMTVRTVARRREMGLLQAVGCTPRQIRVALLAEHLVLGSIAAVVGWFLGGFLSPSLRVGIAAALGPPGFSWPVLGLVIALAAVWVILTAATIGPVRGAVRRPLTEVIRDAPASAAARSAAGSPGCPAAWWVWACARRRAVRRGACSPRWPSRLR